MKYFIIVKWDATRQQTEISASSKILTTERVIEMLVNSLCMLVQCCSEKQHRFSDYELMHRIISCVKSGKQTMPDQDKKIIINLYPDKELINISFPAEQGYIPIEISSDIIATCLHEIIFASRQPEDKLDTVLEVLHSHFVRTDLKPVIIEDQFLIK